MPAETGLEPLYKAFNEFVQLCLIQDQSLLWAHLSIWTPENVAEVKRRVVDNPLRSNLSFVEKLLQQMEGATPEQWMLVADIYFVYYLPSGTITPQKKRAGIMWVIEQSHTQEEHRSDATWDALNVRFIRTGQRYNMKYAQFWLILLLADHLKHQSPAKRQEIMQDSKQLKPLLDSLLASLPNAMDRANDTRRAILHFSFPDQFEPIISAGDRNQIINTYGKLVKPSLPKDDDEALYKIREVLSKRFKPDQLPFNFYEEKMAKEWRETKPSARTREIVEPEPEIEEQTQPEEDKGIIFISYRREDSINTVGRMHDWLVTNFSEERVFRDIGSIPLGVNFRRYLMDYIEQCKVMLVVIGPGWVTAETEGKRRLYDRTDFVRIEVETALRNGIRVIPVFVQNSRPPREDELPPELAELVWYQGIRVGPDPDFAPDMHKLIHNLKQILG